MADNPAGTREKRVEDRLEECIGLFSTVESLAFNHIPGLADFTGLIVQM